jgi:hypothetical protein
VHVAAGQPPQQKTVDRAEGKFAGMRRGTRAVDGVEQPGNLAGGKIRIEHQSGLGGDFRLMTGAPQRIAIIRGAAILPDDGVVNGLAAGAIPDHRGFALIGDADAGYVFGGKAGLGHRAAHGGDRGLPDFFRIMLDMAGRWINLPQFLLRGGERL